MVRTELNSISAAIRKYSFNKFLSSLLLAALTIIAIARALQHFYIIDVYEPIQYTLWWHIPFNLFMWWNWFLFVPIMYMVIVARKSGTYTLLQSIVVYFLLPVVIIFTRQAFATFITTLVLVDKPNFYALLYWRLFSNPWIWLDLIVYFAIFVGIRVVEYQKQNRITQVKFTQLQKQLAQSQLNALQSQLHPHFLFNTLNTISTLILKEDNKEADRMLSLLENFLKTTVFESNRQEIFLEEELRFIQDYLEIEKVRFSDKLEVQEEIEHDTLQAFVPSFLLQPIIENAIYHAIAPKTSKGFIKIITKREKDTLLLIIEDNGPGMHSQKRGPKEGIGLKITKERLVHLFGDNHQLKLENFISGGLRVTITIPFRSVVLNVVTA